MYGKKVSFSMGGTIKQILIYFLLFLAGDLLSSMLLDLLFSAVKLPESWMYQLPRALGGLFLTWLLFWLYTTKILRLRMRDFGITPGIRAWTAAAAVLLPVCVAAVYLAIGEGAAHRVPTGEALGVIAASLAFALKAGITEEMLFRGYMMTLLRERWGRAVAILAPSVLFGCLHLLNLESFSAVGVALLIVSGSLVGIMFSLVADRGGSVGGSALMHTLWNLVMVTGILCITTDQGESGAALFSIVIPSGNVLLTGGDFGVEASAVAVLGYGAVCCLALLMRKTER